MYASEMRFNAAYMHRVLNPTPLCVPESRNTQRTGAQTGVSPHWMQLHDVLIGCLWEKAN